MLANPEVREFLCIAIDDYFKINMGSVGSSGILWEAFKANLRGRIISYQTGLKRQFQQEITDIGPDYDQAVKFLSVRKPLFTHG